MAVLLGLILYCVPGIFDKHIDGSTYFVVSRKAHLHVPHDATLMQRLFVAYINLRERFARKDPTAMSFGPSPVQRYSVQGTLDQSMQITGKRYLIASGALDAVVYFGNTNTLNGAQWVVAFEQALRDQGLVLLSNKVGVVKVIPTTELDAYRKAGLVKSGDQQM
jgi:hypothetical protein